MKRLLSAAVIFAALIIFCVWNTIYVKSSCTKLQNLAENFRQEYVKRGYCPETVKAAKELTEYAGDFCRKITLVARTEHAEEIYCTAERLESLLESESEEITGEAECIKSRAELIRQGCTMI